MHSIGQLDVTGWTASAAHRLQALSLARCTGGMQQLIDANNLDAIPEEQRPAVLEYLASFVSGASGLLAKLTGMRR